MPSALRRPSPSAASIEIIGCCAHFARNCRDTVSCIELSNRQNLTQLSFELKWAWKCANVKFCETRSLWPSCMSTCAMLLSLLQCKRLIQSDWIAFGSFEAEYVGSDAHALLWLTVLSCILSTTFLESARRCRDEFLLLADDMDHIVLSNHSVNHFDHVKSHCEPFWSCRISMWIAITLWTTDNLHGPQTLARTWYWQFFPQHRFSLVQTIFSRERALSASRPDFILVVCSYVMGVAEYKAHEDPSVVFAKAIPANALVSFPDCTHELTRMETL